MKVYGDASGARDVALEAARGVAAIIVVLHHFFLAFAPKFTGFMPMDRTAKSIVGEWYFVLFNGDGAVFFFFVLSGFVLPMSYLRRKDPSILFAGILKRLPRLALPVVLSMCLAVALISMKLYVFGETAQITGSEWLRTAGFANFPPNLIPSYIDAVRQGTTTFFTGQAYYNSSVWTMKPEFIGSIVVYTLLPLALLSGSRVSTVLTLGLVAIASCFVYVHIAPFLAGLSLSIFLNKVQYKMRLPLAGIMIATGLYLMGYVVSIKYYEWVASIEWLWTGIIATNVLFATLGATLIVAALVCSRQVAGPLSGRLGYLLGKLSFPIYLVHHPILMSLSCFVLVRSLEGGLAGWTALNLTLAATLGGVLLVSIPFAIVDTYWVKAVNAVVRKALPRRDPVAAAAPQAGPI